MQKVNSSWARLLVALVAVLVVAGPAMVFASNPDPNYTPRIGVIEGGPLSATTSSAPLVLYVTYTNGQTATVTAPDITFSVNPLAAGSVSAATGSFAPGSGATSGERVQISCTYTQEGVSLHTNRIFVLTP